MMEKITQYSGADWLRSDLGIKEISELGERVAEILGELYYGLYHLQTRTLERVNWSNSMWIEIVLDRDMATYDGDTLTRLVILCHELLVRCEIEGAAPRRLRLIFHKRHNREGGQMMFRHPTIETAVERVRASLSKANQVADEETEAEA